MQTRKNVMTLIEKIKKTKSLSVAKAHAEAIEMLLLDENCRVVLNSHNGNVINTIKAIRNFYHGRGGEVGLREAKEITDKIPYTFKLDQKIDAEALCRELNSVGCVAFII